MSEPEVELVYRVLDWPYVEGDKPTEFIKRVHALTGVRGAVSFVWVPRPVDDKNIRDLERRIGHEMWPMGFDVGYHRRERQSEWEFHHEDCDVIPSKTGCYYDGSSLRATEWLSEFRRRDFDEVWLRKMLRAEYALRFESDDTDAVDDMGLGEVIHRVFGGSES